MSILEVLKNIFDVIGLFQYYRIAAAYMILLIHQQFWWTGAFFDGVKNAAVPLFAAMAGYLIGNSSTDLGIFLRKKAQRILRPYAIWAVVYFVMNWIVLDVCIRHDDFVIPPLRAWLLGGTSCHLWFLPCLFVAFAMKCLMFKVSSLMFKKWTISDSFKHQTSNFFLLLLAIGTQFLPGETSASIYGYCRIYFGRLLLFFALGGIMRNCLFTPTSNSYIFKPLTIEIMGGGAIMLGLANFVLHFIPGLAFQPILFVIGLMLLAIGFGEFKLPKIVGDFANATMGIYLIHVLFTSMANFGLVKIGHSTLSVWIAFPLTVLLFAASYLCVRLLPKWMRG